MSCGYWLLAAAWAVIFTLHIIDFRGYFDCNIFIGPLIISIVLNLFLVRTFFELLQKERWAECSRVGLALCLIYHFLANPVALVTLIVLLVKNKAQCIPAGPRNFDLAVIFINNFFIVIIVTLLVVAFIRNSQLNKRKEEMANQLQNIYELVYDPGFDLNAFLEENQEVLKVLKFSEKDLAVLRDLCGGAYGKEQANLAHEDKQECPICLGEYTKEDRIITHPGCGHIFHDLCLKDWLTGEGHDPTCPYCKINTRIELFALIERRRIETNNSMGLEANATQYSIPDPL